MATPKPRPSYNNPWTLMTPNRRPSIILPASPTAFSFYTLHNLKPVKPTSPTLSSLIPQSNRNAGPDVLQETLWPMHGIFFFKLYIPKQNHSVICYCFDHSPPLCRQQAKLTLSRPILSLLFLGCSRQEVQG